MKTLPITSAPNEVQKALSHVQDFFPEVNRVQYDEDGYWTFFNADGSAPNFDDYDIHQDTLEAAADAVYGLETPVEYKE